MALTGRKLHAFVKENARKNTRKLAPADSVEEETDDEDIEDDDPPPKKKAKPGVDDTELVTKVAEKLDDGDIDEKLTRLVTGEEPDDEDTAPSWALDERLWMRAVRAAKSRWKEFDQPWLLVAHVYQELGGEVE